MMAVSIRTTPLHALLVASLLPDRARAWGPGSPTANFWVNGSVHLIEVSHSDIFFTGRDILLDGSEIAKALDIMRNDSSFKWQHECMLFLRSFIELYPEREQEVVQRLREGRFDIGATFTEGFESSMYNEALVRQMYEGRKWFVERYPGIDSAVVAFHQDAPLRALQMPQVYSKAGVRYLKASRFSDKIFRWASPDGSSLLAFEEFH
jgi:alpha-mannosidase